MAVSISKKASNGVSFGANYTVTAADVTDETKVYEFDFNTSYELAASVMCAQAADGTLVAPAKVTSVAGVITVTFTSTPTEGDVISVVAQRAN